MRLIYLDYAAATPLDPQAYRAMKPYFAGSFHNPSANYLKAREVRQALESARAEVAGCLGAKPAEIVFTAGATEANNLAIQGVMRAYPDGEILISAIEHESVLEPARLFKHQLVPVNEEGSVNLARLEKLITDKTVLVSVGLINNEIGVVQPIAKIAKLLNKLSNLRRNNHRPLYLHSDAAQAPSFVDLHAARLGVDLMSLNGGKIYGPKQSGALFVKAGTAIQPLILGGGQESGMRSGTENVAGVIGFAAALRSAQQRRKSEANRTSELKEFFIKEIKENIPHSVINGRDKQSAPHIVSVTFPGVDNERLMMQLDESGVQVAAGSACSASSLEPSHVLSAIGLSDALIHSTIRFSFGRQTRKDDIVKAVKLLRPFVAVH